MPRKGPVEKRKIKPDMLYNSVRVAKFINNLMKKGKKSLAEKIFYSALDLIKKKTKKDGIVVFETAMNNVRPLVEVRPRRVGGATYQVPMEVEDARAEALATRWILNYARQRKGKSMVEKLAAELIDASMGIGSSIKKREDTHRMAEANKAFSHFRW